jgi:tetratricopeptide (TPR) repeat protein
MRRWIASLLAAVACVACSSPEERLAEHLRNGALLAEQEDFDDAIVEYRSALKLAPSSAEVNERLGEQLAATEPNDAAVYYSDAFRLDRKRTHAALEAARILAPNDLDAATQLVNEVVSHAPRLATAHIQKSEFALLANDSRAGLAAALTASRLDPELAPGWYQVGRSYQARIAERQHRRRNFDREFDAAIDAFTKADELASGSARSRLEMARVYATRFRYRQRAQTEFKNAMDLAKEAGNLRDRLEIAEAALSFSSEVNDPIYTEWALRAVIEAAPEQLLAWSRLAMLEDSRGGDGLAVLEELIEKRPRDLSARLIYVAYLTSSRQATQALTHLRGLLDSGWGAPEFWEQIARIQIQRGRTSGARATYVTMLDYHPDDPVSRRTDARIAIAERRYEAASASLRALATEADSKQIQYLLAKSELGRRNLANATAALERAEPKVGTAPREVMRLRAEIHHAAGEFELAAKSLRKLTRSGATLKPSETLMLAQSLYETDRAAGGRKLLENLLAKPLPLAGAAAEYARREGEREPEKAYQYLTAALERNPIHFAILEQFTRIDTDAGRIKRAMRRLDKALATGRANARVALLRGRTLAESGKYAKAERDVLRALEADPMLEGAVDLLFSIYANQGTLLDAQQSFEEAEAAGVLHSGARQLLGRLYRHHGETDRAKQTLEKIESDDPKMLAAKSDLARLLAETDTDLDRALELAENVQQHRSRDAGAADVVGYVYLRKGLSEAALQQFQFAIELDELHQRSSTAQRQYHLGLALRAMNRNPEASQAFEEALRLDPEFSSAEDTRSQLESIQSSDGFTSNSS